MRNSTIATIAIIVTATLLTLAIAQPALAGGASKEEKIGVGTGCVIGAIAGGPFGLIIGAALGAKIGDSFHNKVERIDTLEGSLDGSRNSVATLKSDIDELSEEVERLRHIARPELVNLMQAGIAMDLLFRTDEFALTDTTGDRLTQMASTLATMPDIHIQLDGFADERGDSNYNFALSEKRVEFVRKLFVASGVHPARINVAAHGESVAQDTNIDSYAFERRVSVKLFINNAPSVAVIASQAAN